MNNGDSTYNPGQ